MMRLLATLTLSCLVASASTARAAECAKACPAIFSPVCGSNGKTYGNTCELELEKCKTNDAALRVASTGECATGKPECAQEFACLDVAEPVCGSNGVTYVNKCVLQKAQCVDKSIQKAYDGECKKDGTSAPPTTTAPPAAGPSASPSPTTTAPPSSSSSPPPSSSSGSGTDDDAVCSRECTKEIDFVCGSDGKTYANECLLEEKKDCGSPTLTKASDGQCGSSSPSTTTTPAPTTGPATSTGNAASLVAGSAVALGGSVVVTMYML